MSELKAINAYQLTTNTEDSDVYIHNDDFGCGGDLVECYLKSEADKVIADLEMKLARAKLVLRLNTPEALYSNLETMSRLNHEKYVIERRERHHKYKRCLAMAWWCSAELGMLVSTWESKIKYYKRWQKRWQGLAKTFKEEN